MRIFQLFHLLPLFNLQRGPTREPGSVFHRFHGKWATLHSGRDTVHRGKPGLIRSKSSLSPMGCWRGSDDPFYQILTANHAASRSHMLGDTSNCLLIGTGAWGKPEATQRSFAERGMQAAGWRMGIRGWKSTGELFHRLRLLIATPGITPLSIFGSLTMREDKWRRGLHIRVNLTLKPKNNKRLMFEKTLGNILSWFWRIIWNFFRIILEMRK